MLEHINTGEPWKGERINGIAHPRSIETAWDADALQAVGLRVRPAPVPAAPSLEDLRHYINNERDRRIGAGFEVDFGVIVGVKSFDSNPSSRENIAGAQSLALGAILAGAQVGDMRWADPDNDFVWICADNTTLPMDAHTLREFCEAAMSYKSALTLAARTLKDLPQIPEDYANDQYWPSRTLALA